MEQWFLGGWFGQKGVPDVSLSIFRSIIVLKREFGDPNFKILRN